MNEEIKVNIDAPKMEMKNVSKLTKLANKHFKGLEGRKVLVTHKFFRFNYFQGTIGRDEDGYFIIKDSEPNRKISIAYNLPEYEYLVSENL